MPDVYIHDCGVIPPDGEFFGCMFGGHGAICRHIIDLYHDDQATKGSILLLSSGGVVIEDPDNEFEDYYFTDDQLEALHDICRATRCPDNLRECAQTALALHDGALDMGTSRYRRLKKRQE